jgi:hypothetical protein
MKTICIIINGINLPYNVIDYAVAEAKKNSSEIHAIFLKGTHEPSKGYGYPSDLPATETWVSDEEAVNDDEKLISDNMKLLKQMIEDEKISYHSALLTKASVDELAEITATADLVVVDENFDEMFLLGDSKISLKDLKNRISVPVYTVQSQK